MQELLGRLRSRWLALDTDIAELTGLLTRHAAQSALGTSTDVNRRAIHSRIHQQAGKCSSNDEGPGRVSGCCNRAAHPPGAGYGWLSLCPVMVLSYSTIRTAPPVLLYNPSSSAPRG
jgi:hypothetical protein